MGDANGENVELTGDSLPYHLRPDAQGAECSGCGRRSWSEDEWNGACVMPQPNGSLCLGSIGWPFDVPRTGRTEEA